ncbi:MAG: DUF3307 domain-containing protein [Breznakibacter sp.]
MMLLLKLLLAHLAGDFMLQPNSWVKAKETNKFGTYPLYLHTAIHFALLMLLVCEEGFWKWALLIALLHFIIDVAKLSLQTETTKRKWFFIDQAAHLAVIGLVWLIIEHPAPSLDQAQIDYAIALLTFGYFLTLPTSIILRNLLEIWPINADNSLKNAGKYIGILERLLVFAFVLTNHWEAIGFLIAAKSVFRFGDLKVAREIKLTEYVLVGTMLSFGIAIGAGMLFNRIMAP